MTLGLVLRGVAMGIAEVVPGVSGGTIAFVTGIYDEFLRTLAGLNLGLIQAWWQRGWTAMWNEYNLGFLLRLGLGMVAGVLLFAKVMHYALEQMAPVVWAFFFGLIVYSVVDMGRRIPLLKMLTLGVVGLALGFIATRLVPTTIEPSLYWIGFGGALAVSAWLLPAVSGSFLLLVLGLYEPVLDALAEFRIDVLVALLCGCAVGMLLFSRLLHWLMSQYRETVVAVLVGFMAGSLVKLWPWSFQNQPLSPEQYTELTQGAAFVWPSVFAMVLGMVLIWGLSRIKV